MGVMVNDWVPIMLDENLEPEVEEKLFLLWVVSMFCGQCCGSLWIPILLVGEFPGIEYFVKEALILILVEIVSLVMATIFTAGTAAELRITGDVTCFATLRVMTDSSLGSYIMGMGDEGAASGDNWNYLFWLNSGSFRGFHEYGSGINGGQPILSAFPQADTAFGVFTIALVRDNTANDYTWYIDGIAVETDTYGTDPDGGTTGSFRIGGSSINSFFLDKCLMRNAAVYDSALSASQVAALHAQVMG